MPKAKATKTTKSETPTFDTNDFSKAFNNITENQWAMFAHIAGLAAFIVPFSNLAIPLIIWQLKKASMKFAGEQALEALNFQLTLTIASMIIAVGFVVAGVLSIILVGFLFMPFLFIATIGLMILDVVMSIRAAIDANNGKATRYPWTIRLVK